MFDSGVGDQMVGRSWCLTVVLEIKWWGDLGV